MKKSKKYTIYALIVFSVMPLFLIFTLSLVTFGESGGAGDWTFFAVQSIVMQLPFAVLMPIYCKKQGINPWLNLAVCLSAITIVDIVYFVACAKIYLVQHFKSTFEGYINNWAKLGIQFALPAALLVVTGLVCSTIITVIKPKFLYHVITVAVLSFVALCSAVLIPVLKMNIIIAVFLVGIFIPVIDAPFSIITSIYASKRGINKWVNFAVCSGVMLLSSISLGTSYVLTWRNSPLFWPATPRIISALVIIGVIFGASLIFPVLSLIFTSILGERGDKKLAEKSKG